MLFTFIEFLQIFIIVQGFIFTFLLLIKNKRIMVRNYLLSGILICLSSQILLIFLLSKGFFTSFLNTFSWFFSFMYFPLIYFYSKSVISKNFNFTKRDFLQFLPSSLFVILVLFNIQFKDDNFLYWIMLISIVVYLYIIFKNITHFEKNLKNLSSSVELFKLTWLKYLFLYFILIIVIDFTRFINHNETYEFYTTIVFYILSILLINTIMYKGLNYPDISLIIENEDLAKLKKKIKPIEINNANEKLLLMKLQSFMENSKIYLNPSLTLLELSQQTDIPSRQISNLINNTLQLNFSEFINSYRLDYAINLICNNDNDTIQGIMYQSGFNSKSVFNTIFKKKTGLTPSAYIKGLTVLEKNK